MVNVGVIGLGFMGLTHLKAYREHPRARLVAVADQVKARLEGDLSGVQGNIMGPGERFDFSGVRTYERVEDILADPEVELVSVCLPTFLHAAVVKQALERGKHVLCEKPMALTEGELDEMLAAARSGSGLFMVAQCIRFWPEYVKARELVAAGSLGPVRAVRLERRSAFPTWGGWLGDEAKSGGAIVDLSIHDIDYAQHLLGMPTRLRAEGCVAPGKYDYYQGSLEFGSVPVTIEGSWLHPGTYPFNAAFDILCEEATVSFNLGMDRPLTIFRADGTDEHPEVAEGDGYSRQVDYMISCVEEGREPALSPPEESAASVRLALLLKRSREAGGIEIEVSGV